MSYFRKMPHPLDCMSGNQEILKTAIRILTQKLWLSTRIKSGVKRDLLYSLPISACLNNTIKITLVFLHDLALKTQPGTSQACELAGNVDIGQSIKQVF